MSFLSQQQNTYNKEVLICIGYKVPLPKISHQGNQGIGQMWEVQDTVSSKTTFLLLSANEGNCMVSHLHSLSDQRLESLPPTPCAGVTLLGSGIRKEGKGKVWKEMTPMTKPMAVGRKMECILGVQALTLVFLFLLTLCIQY